MKVRALATGQYPTKTVLGEDFKRRHEGDVFELYDREVLVLDPQTKEPVMKNGEFQKRVIPAAEQFSRRWMERVDEDEPEVLTGAQTALTRQTQAIKASRRPSAE